MKTSVSVLALTLLTGFARAEDALVTGGRSPDGSCEVRIALAASDPSDYAIHIHAASKAKPFFTLEGTGGVHRYQAAKEGCRAVWHPSGKVVVITDQGTRHSREIYVVAVSGDSARRIQVPDYVQNALGRVNDTEIDLHCVSTPESWEGDDLPVTLQFSVSNPEHGRLLYNCAVTLHLSHGPNTAPSVRLKNVSTPVPEDGG